MAMDRHGSGAHGSSSSNDCEETREEKRSEKTIRRRRNPNDCDDGKAGSEEVTAPLYPAPPTGTTAEDELAFKVKEGQWYWFLAKPSRWRLTVRLIFSIVVTISISFGVYIGWDYAYKLGLFEGKQIICKECHRTPPIVITEVPEGGPCRRWIDEDECPVTDKIKWSANVSLYYLKRGDADNAVGNYLDARQHYRQAIDIGRTTGAQWAVIASRRLQLIDMTCGPWDKDSLARISRDYDKNPLGSLIDVKQKQRALRALGHYSGDIDNRHSSDFRAAAREFQRHLLQPETGALNAEQTVLLICAGAQIVNEVSSQNVLGIMYGTGLGVRQNTDFAVTWLERAAQRGDSDALWNLAVMYGTGTIMSSVSLCDIVQSAERADSYLAEAAALGHPAAIAAMKKYPDDTPKDRWAKLSGDLNQPEALKRVGRACNPNG